MMGKYVYLYIYVYLLYNNNFFLIAPFGEEMFLAKHLG